MSENTPTSPHESEPQGTDSLESQTPETAPEETPGSEKSFGAEAIVNAPPTAEISETDATPEANATPEAEESPQAPLATEAGQFRTAPMDMDLPFRSGPSEQAQDTSYPTQQYTRSYPQTLSLIHI